MQTVDVVVGLLILVGLLGIVLPILPGVLLIAVAVIGWAAVVGGVEAWSYAVAAVIVLAAGTALKYAVPGRRLRTDGIPNRTLLVGGLLGVIGFFVVPVVGLLIGFVLGVYLAEAHRLGTPAAWPSTKAAVKAVGLSVLIELAAGMAAAIVWGVGALAT